MERRTFLKAFGLVAAVPTPAVLPAVTVSPTGLAEVELMSVLVGKRNRLIELLDFTCRLAKNPGAATYRDFTADQGLEQKSPFWWWDRDFRSLVINSNAYEGLEKQRLADITEDRLAKAFQSAGEGCWNLDKYVKELRRLEALGVKTVGDLHTIMSRKMLEYLPGIINDDIEFEGLATGDQEYLAEILGKSSQNFPSVFENYPDFPQLIRERIKTVAVASGTRKTKKLSKRARQALAEAERQRRRFSVRKANEIGSEWQCFEVAWGRKEADLTRVDFHLLRLKLCKPSKLASDTYKPGDIRLEPSRRQRNVIVSTRDMLMKRHLLQCVHGNTSLFPKP